MIRAKTSMASATGGLTSRVVRTFDRHRSQRKPALDIEAVTAWGQRAGMDRRPGWGRRQLYARPTGRTSGGASSVWLDESMRSHLGRLRLGILLIILSWFPFAQILISVLRDHGHLTSDSSATNLRFVVWGIQIVVGLVGLLLAGK